jgi:hypothetical protein
MASSPPATEEAGAMGREIESRQGIHREVAFKKYRKNYWDISVKKADLLKTENVSTRVEISEWLVSTATQSDNLIKRKHSQDAFLEV